MAVPSATAPGRCTLCSDREGGSTLRSLAQRSKRSRASRVLAKPVNAAEAVISHPHVCMPHADYRRRLQRRRPPCSSDTTSACTFCGASVGPEEAVTEHHKIESTDRALRRGKGRKLCPHFNLTQDRFRAGPASPAAGSGLSGVGFAGLEVASRRIFQRSGRKEPVKPEVHHVPGD